MNETLKEMWDTRPPRIPKKQGGNAMIAGICEGIAVRYRIDVLLVRVAFVALSFVFGVGLFTYILCGFLMPRFGMSASPAEVISRPNEELTDAERDDRTTGWVLLVLLIIFFPTLSVGAGGELVFSALGGLVAAAVAWWALHQRTPVPPAGLVVPPTAQKPHEPKTQPEPPVTARFTPPEGHEHPAGPEPAAPTPPRRGIRRARRQGCGTCRTLPRSRPRNRSLRRRARACGCGSRWRCSSRHPSSLE